MTNIPCIIIAGGKSSRMGCDKALLPFSSSPTLSEFQYKRLSNFFKKTYISCKSSDKFNFEANFIEDIEYEDSAPFIALISIFEELEDEYVFVLSVDTPFFGIEDFKTLHDNLENEDAIVAKTKDGYQPLCAIYKKTSLPILKSLTKERKYRFSGLYDKIKVKYIEFENDKSFDNLNYYDDYKKAVEYEKGSD